MIYVFFKFLKINCQHLKLTVNKMQNIKKESLNFNGVILFLKLSFSQDIYGIV